MALLGEHKEGLLACDSFEEIMEYLKNVVPNVDRKILDKVMKQVCILPAQQISPVLNILKYSLNFLFLFYFILFF